MDYSLVIPAFLAGLLTFLAPCTLPLVPAYMGFISGASPEALANPGEHDAVRRKVLWNGVFFILGFSLIFILFGTLAGLLGTALAPYRLWLARLGGILVILFGLFMLGIFKIPYLQRDYRITAPASLRRGRPATSLALGSAFGIGWTPCVGPVLGSVLLLTSATATALQGAFLLAVFSLGLAIPFLLVAAGMGKALPRLAASRMMSVISIVGGLFLIGLGILLFTGHLPLLISEGFQLFRFFNYEAILEYL